MTPTRHSSCCIEKAKACITYRMTSQQACPTKVRTMKYQHNLFVLIFFYCPKIIIIIIITKHRTHDYHNYVSILHQLQAITKLKTNN